jgi:hypothetical protein
MSENSLSNVGWESNVRNWARKLAKNGGDDSTVGPGFPAPSEMPVPQTETYRLPSPGCWLCRLRDPNCVRFRILRCSVMDSLSGCTSERFSCALSKFTSSFHFPFQNSLFLACRELLSAFTNCICLRAVWPELDGVGRQTSQN